MNWFAARNLAKPASSFLLFSLLGACSGAADNAVLGGTPTDAGEADASSSDGTAPSGIELPDATSSTGRDGGDTGDATGAPDAGPPDTGSSCVPDDSADCANRCGTLRGRCAQILNCGGCLTGESCGGGGQNTCGPNACVPDCAGKVCGATDGCGSLCGAGSCGAGLRCVSGACRCDATSCASGCCSNNECKTGTTTLACGIGGNACETCTPSQACSAGTCAAVACPSGTAPCASGCCKPILSVGSNFACAVERGALSCWGDNAYGKLGTGGPAASTHWLGPVDVALTGAVVSAITAGESHACALTAGGGVKCWGDNSLGQVGNGSTGTALAPTDVVGLGSGVTSVTTKVRHTCAVLSTGAVKCWGAGSYGKLGNASTTESRVPVDVLSLNGAASAVAVGETHSCALLTTGAVKCWGDNAYGQLGSASSGSSLLPVEVFGLASGVKQIAAGTSHTCALTTAGGVKCWGDNFSGQLGTGTTANTFVPLDVLGLSSGVAAITASNENTCALMTSGTVSCWGSNRSGQLGNASTTNSLVPAVVTSLSGAIAVESGGFSTCVALGTGAFQCWGANEAGQLATGSRTNANVPTSVVQTCDTTTCGNGCCSAGRCNGASSSDSCGTGGSVCSPCANGQACMAGSCGCTFPYQTCATGCCLVTTDAGANTNTLVVPSTVGGMTGGEFTLFGAQKTPRLSTFGGPCPVTLASGSPVPTLYIEVANRSAFPRNISIWSKATAANAGAPAIDTLMGVYAGAVPPVTDTQRAQCLAGTSVNDRCTSQIPTACMNDWAGLVADDNPSGAVTVPALSSITVMVQRYFDAETDSLVGINVRLEP